MVPETDLEPQSSPEWVVQQFHSTPKTQRALEMSRCTQRAPDSLWCTGGTPGVQLCTQRALDSLWCTGGTPGVQLCAQRALDLLWCTHCVHREPWICRDVHGEPWCVIMFAFGSFSLCSLSWLPTIWELECLQSFIYVWYSKLAESVDSGL